MNRENGSTEKADGRVSRTLERLRPWRLTREVVLAAVLVVQVLVLSQLSPYFLTISNLLDATRFFVESGLIALGMTLVIITKGIDLSVGSLFALVSVTVGFSYAAGVPLAVAIMLGLFVGVAGGAFNGALVALLGLSPLTVTLGTFALFRGIAFAWSQADAVSTFPDWFLYFGQFYVGGIVPAQLFVFVLASVAAWLLLSRTPFGRYVYGVGLNERATLFSGAPAKWSKFAVYVIVGGLVAVAAIIYTSRVSTARANAGFGLELAVIAAVALGGVDIKGGSGKIAGTVLGVLILATLQNGLTLAGVSNDLGLLVTGVVLVIGVFSNEFFRGREVG
jgi:ribose/xylose/arabinose/galactoside ABC-type transport system permease subunit